MPAYEEHVSTLHLNFGWLLCRQRGKMGSHHFVLTHFWLNILQWRLLQANAKWKYLSKWWTLYYMRASECPVNDLWSTFGSQRTNTPVQFKQQCHKHLEHLLEKDQTIPLRYLGIHRILSLSFHIVNNCAYWLYWQWGIKLHIFIFNSVAIHLLLLFKILNDKNRIVAFSRCL